MAHVHGADGMTAAAKAAGKMKGMAESAKSAGGMGEMGMGPMMGGMGPGAGHVMANMPQAATGAAMSATSQAEDSYRSWHDIRAWFSAWALPPEF